MPDKLKEIKDKILGYWNKFDKKQKRIIISVFAVLVIAFGVLGWAVSRPNYETLIKCASASDAAEVKKVLDEDGRFYKLSEDSLTFTVYKKDYAELTLLLADNNVPKTGYGYEDVLASNSGLLPPSESQIKLQEKIAKQHKIEEMLEANKYVKDAIAEISIPNNTYSILNKDEETTATVTVVTTEDIPPEAGETLAKQVAYMVGNKTTDNIIIVDSFANVLFAGSKDTNTSISTNINSQLTVKQQLESSLSTKLRTLILTMDRWDDVAVAANLDANFDESSKTTITYSTADGRDEGYRGEYYISSSENTTGSGGTPGVASNTTDDDTDYQMSDSSNSSSTTTEQINYLVNQTIEETKGATGVVHLENSSITVALTKYRFYNEADLRAQGQLDEMTFDEFRAQNSEPLEITMDSTDSMYNAISMATGISTNKISIMVTEIPIFQASLDSDFQIANYLPLIVMLIILALLAFVVFRSTRTVEVVETEPEMSVDNLIAATNNNTTELLDDIDLQDKSEARKAIEKFVDENPEAVALLLRSWLDDDWE